MYKELPYNFLEIAKSDLSASKCLFNNDFYPQSLFFFQQSVEKAVKSYSHKSSALFIDWMKKFFKLDHGFVYVKRLFRKRRNCRFVY